MGVSGRERDEHCWADNVYALLRPYAEAFPPEVVRDVAGLIDHAADALERVAALETALAERAASWEAKAIEADAASDSYRGHDVEAAVSLARDANRARNRATELRELAALAEGSAAQEETR